MREAAKRTPDWQPPTTAPGQRAPDPLTMRLRWRLITRPARSISEAAGLRINHLTRAAAAETPLHRWRPMSAPSSPVPPWRWPGRARAERASRRSAINERWRPLTAR